VRHELKATERAMAEASAQVAELTTLLGQAGTDHGELTTVGSQLADAQSRLDSAEERWLALSSELDEIDGNG